MEPFDVNRNDLERAVSECGLFGSVSGVARDDLLDAFDGVRIVTGETIMHEGDPAEHMYIVRHGRLRATVLDSEGAEVVVGGIGKNEVVGEMAVITDQDRSATVTAARDTDLFRLPTSSFARLVQLHPQMLRPFASVVVDRLRNAMSRPPIPAMPATVVVFAPADIDALEFVRQLASGLASYRTAVITADDAEGRDDVAKWLLDIENDVDVSFLLAEPEPTEWTRRCLRHADHVELIVDEHTPVTLGALADDAECAKRLDEVPVHLVFVHRDVPTTGKWLDLRPFASYANLQRGDADGIARLARLLSGRANIMVLGGGGARGFAHFGVVRALREGGVPVDGIIGASAGAVVGALLARNHDAIDAQTQMLDWFDSVRWRGDFNPPALALTSGRLMTEGLQELGGGLDIEQLPIGFAAVTCDLVAAEAVVHDRGPVWQAIRASGSVPGLFPPVRVGDRLLVDGGLVANMPTDLARRRHPNSRLIAVDVGDPAGIVTGGSTHDGVVSGWHRLRRRTTPDTVTLARLLMRLTELGRNDSTDSADLTITPDVRGFGITETKAARQIIERGYEAGRQAVESGTLAEL